VRCSKWVAAFAVVADEVSKRARSTDLPVYVSKAVSVPEVVKGFVA